MGDDIARAIVDPSDEGDGRIVGPDVDAEAGEFSDEVGAPSSPRDPCEQPEAMRQ
jgi:hypothetical protein